MTYFVFKTQISLEKRDVNEDFLNILPLRSENDQKVLLRNDANFFHNKFLLDDLFMDTKDT